MNKHQKIELVGTIILVLCIIIVAGWEIAAKVAAQPFDELRLKADDFTGFSPQSNDWSIRLVHVKASPTEPTIIAFVLRGRGGSKAESRKQKAEIGTADDEHFPLSTSHFPLSTPVLVRIVHGYNMVDCMRIKQYEVELLADTREGVESGAGSVERGKWKVEGGDSEQRTEVRERRSEVPYQMWGLKSATEERSIWVTTMLRSADFAATKVDTRDMAFPQVGTPDDPSWAPTGLKWSSFRHPIRNARLALRAKWNASRCDIWTFLRLRQPAWASDEMLTLVTEYRGPSVLPEQEPAIAQYTLQAHQFMLGEFQRFWKRREKTREFEQGESRDSRGER